jgi:hypothetical protein
MTYHHRYLCSGCAQKTGVRRRSAQKEKQEKLRLIYDAVPLSQNKARQSKPTVSARLGQFFGLWLLF